MTTLKMVVRFFRVPEGGRQRAVIPFVVRFLGFRMKEDVLGPAWQKKGFMLENHKISLDRNCAPDILARQREHAHVQCNTEHQIPDLLQSLAEGVSCRERTMV